MNVMADNKNNNLLWSLLIGGGLAKGASAAIRRRNKSRHAADATKLGVIHERNDQRGGTDDNVEPKKFTLWVVKENEESDLGHDLYMINSVAPPDVVRKSDEGFIRAVVRDIEKGLAEAEAAHERRLESDED
jgi:hypothetical protein